MPVSNVKITEGCINCALCEQLCPQVFKMGDASAEVISGVNFGEYESGIRKAAESCPVTVIEVNE
ncbi:MAG: ferredoxin [Candidatus Margulisiibacteriota bacterium]